MTFAPLNTGMTTDTSGASNVGTVDKNFQNRTVRQASVEPQPDDFHLKRPAVVAGSLKSTLPSQ
jgi:hypothetical protein